MTTQTNVICRLKRIITYEVKVIGFLLSVTMMVCSFADKDSNKKVINHPSHSYFSYLCPQEMCIIV